MHVPRVLEHGANNYLVFLRLDTVPPSFLQLELLEVVDAVIRGDAEGTVHGNGFCHKSVPLLVKTPKLCVATTDDGGTLVPQELRAQSVDVGPNPLHLGERQPRLA